jgi:arylsulfatase A-like enzyme
VAVFGDHGEEFGEHAGRAHGSTVFAEQVRVAMLLAGPGLTPGPSNAPATTASIPATVLDLLGIRAAPTMTEPSLVPILAADAPAPAIVVSEAHSNRSFVGYTGERLRLVTDPVFDIDMLFDSDADPLEQHDLAAARPADLLRMRRLAREWDETH